MIGFLGCSNVLLQPNNTLKHEIQIDNLKNLRKMLSSENNFSEMELEGISTVDLYTKTYFMP
jgi:hypothetical protein